MIKNIFNEDFEVVVSVGLDEADDLNELKKKAARALAISKENLPLLVIKRKSIDARRGKISLVYTLGVEDPLAKERQSERLSLNVKGQPVIIVGAGPAGLFCAYELARHGIASVLLERGKMVQARRQDLKGLHQHGIVDRNSNYCFGEGGAGTYSDGKLYTRAHKRGSVREILEILVAHGANTNILTEARPHIGSNKLPKVITALRENLEGVGVVFQFGASVVDLLLDKGRARGVRLANGQEIIGQAVVVATGHSARDIYKLLDRVGAHLEAKSFAMGVRIEHPQALINSLQYGSCVNHPKLPQAYYRLAYTPADGRGAFSFCMCPGGWIVPASTEPDGLVVNGMSLSKRDSLYANSGLVVAVTTDDFKALGLTESLAGIVLQEKLEREAMVLSRLGLAAPAARACDFVRGRLSASLPSTSYIPGLLSADLTSLFDVTGLPLAQRLKDALINFNRLMPGYLTNEAVLVGVESRTSSPVRIVRDPSTLSSNIHGLYPCGEGAGYAGGIVSAAMDGVKVARRLVEINLH